MKKFLVELSKFVVACSGPALTVYHIHLFKKYFANGTQSPDALHTVLLNSHGVNRYITGAQDQILSISLGVAVIMLIVFFAMTILKIRKKI